MIILIPYYVRRGGYAGPPLVTKELAERISALHENLRETQEVLRRLARDA